MASHEAGYDAGILMLLIAAAQAGPHAAEPKEVDIRIALGLHACGWGFGPTVRPADPHEVDQLTRETATVLRRLRAHDAELAFRGRRPVFRRTLERSYRQPYELRRTERQFMAAKFATIDDYIASYPDDVQAILEKVRRTIKSVVPARPDRAARHASRRQARGEIEP
ncbi:MAG: hypothetical protein ACR2JG_10935 [Geodermatophilaceae bacterium]